MVTLAVVHSSSLMPKNYEYILVRTYVGVPTILKLLSNARLEI